MAWRKSSYSDSNGGSCVEVASSDQILVRDTTDQEGATLALPATSWQRFADSLKQ